MGRPVDTDRRQIASLPWRRSRRRYPPTLPLILIGLGGFAGAISRYLVDEEERIRAVLPELDKMVGDGLITLEKVDVLAYRGRGPQPR